MSDKEKDFHFFALQSSLFKGHSDWYFSFLKSERIAHVLSVLLEKAHGRQHENLKTLVEHATEVPATIAHLAADEADLPQVLAEIFSIIASVRLCATSMTLTKETSQILVTEYEALAEKLDAAARLSPFVTPEDFLIPSVEQTYEKPPEIRTEIHKRLVGDPDNIKDINKGQERLSKNQQDRSGIILAFVRSRSGVSIKDISAVVIGCSEKTIQRELALLIKKGFVRRVGERRWSLYEAVSDNKNLH